MKLVTLVTCIALSSLGACATLSPVATVRSKDPCLVDEQMAPESRAGKCGAEMLPEEHEYA